MFYSNKDSISPLFEISEETQKHVHEYALTQVYGYPEDEEPEDVKMERIGYEKGFLEGIRFCLEYQLGEWE